MKNKAISVLFVLLCLAGQISHIYCMTQQDDGSGIPGVIVTLESKTAQRDSDRELKVVDLEGQTDDDVVAGLASMNITVNTHGKTTGGQRDESPIAADDSKKSTPKHGRSKSRKHGRTGNGVEGVASMSSQKDSDDSRSKNKARHGRKPSSVDKDGKGLAPAKSSYVEINKNGKRQVFDVTPRKLYLMVDNFSKSKDYPRHRALAYNNDHLRKDAETYFTQFFQSYPDSLGYLLKALASNTYSKAIYLFFYLLHTKLVNPFEFLDKVKEMDGAIQWVSGDLKLLGIRYGKMEFATQGGAMHGGSKHNLVESAFPELFIIEGENSQQRALNVLANHDIYELSGLFFKKMALSPALKTPIRSDSSASDSQSKSHTRRGSKGGIWAFTEQELADINEILSKQDGGCCSSCGSCSGCGCCCCVIL